MVGFDVLKFRVEFLHLCSWGILSVVCLLVMSLLWALDNGWEVFPPRGSGRVRAKLLPASMSDRVCKAVGPGVFFVGKFLVRNSVSFTG